MRQSLNLDCNAASMSLTLEPQSHVVMRHQVEAAICKVIKITPVALQHAQPYQPDAEKYRGRG